MKRNSLLPILTCVSLILSLGALPPGKTPGGFDRLKGFLGTWKGKDSQGNAVTATYRLIADETAIMETLVRGEANETIVRVFYLDNGVLMLTQYGTRGNQPRMRIDRQRINDNTIQFSLQDVTDSGGEQSVQIRNLVLTQRDKSHLEESWTVRTSGAESMESALMERSSLDNAGAGLERMKSLLGSWKGKDAHGKSVEVTYTYVADSTAIMESLDIGGSMENMVTVYTLNNGNTVLTHYCSMGNQPRMKLDGSKSSENSLVYAYVDATNVKSERDPKMHDLTLTFKDKDHFSQEWILRIEGKDNSTVYEFERVKSAEQSSGW
jgi:hypothetical protein